MTNENSQLLKKYFVFDADSITLRRKSTPVDDFVDHFISLTPQSTMEEGFFADAVHNTWFAEYWMNKFQCQIGGANMPQLFTTPCSGVFKWIIFFEISTYLYQGYRDSVIWFMSFCMIL